MSLELVPRNSPYYDGSPLVFVDNDHFINNSGANLLVTNARNGQSVGFIYPTERCRRGISAYTANPKMGLIAVARRCRPPTIDIVAWPSKGASPDNSGPPYISNYLGQEVKAMATGGAALEYGAVALSRKGERIAAISVLADYVLTVWDLPPDDSNYSDGRAPEAILVASVVLPCVCDTVSFNPSNPSMLAVTATSAHHDGVGGGHPGGLFLYNVSTSHGHTSLVLTEAKLEDLPAAYSAAKEASDLEAASSTDGTSKQTQEEEESAMLPAVWNEESAVGDGHGEEEEEEEALHRGFHPHAVGGLSVAVAVWGPQDVVYVGTTAGIVGKFYALTGELLESWSKGLDNGSEPSPVVGLVLTKNFLVVASRAKMLYWLNLKTFNAVEHTATIFGIRDVNPPERVAHLTHSPNFRSLIVATLEGTIHEHTVEPPADVSKRSVVTGIPDILPILLDYHEAFVLCVASTHIPMVIKDPKAAPGTTEEVELYATGGSDGNLRIWWESDGAPAAAKSYRALRPTEPQDVSEYDSEEDEDDNDNSMGDDQAALDALEDNMDDMGENQMIAVSEDGTENSEFDADEHDPFEMPPVPVTALAAMPGRPVLAVGLADGELSLVFLHDEAGHNAITSGDSIDSNSSSQRMRRVSSRESGPTGKYTHPHGAHISLMPLDLKQISRKPVTHLSFGGGDTVPPVLAVGCAAEGSVHIIEMTEPNSPQSELVAPPIDGAPPNIFRVLARFEVGAHNESNNASVNGSVAGTFNSSKGARISSLTWASPEVLLVGTSDGAVYSYAINTQHPTDDYSPTQVANAPVLPIALLRNAGATIDPMNGGGGVEPSSEDVGDVTPFTNMIVIPENLHSEESIPGGSLVCISPAAKTPALYELPPLTALALKRGVKDLHQSGSSRVKRNKTGDSDSDVGGITETEDEAITDEEVAAAAALDMKNGVGFNGLPLLDLAPHPTVFSSFIQRGHSLGIGCSALCTLEANGADGTALVATGGIDGSIVLWMITAQGTTRVSDFQVHDAPVVAISFSATGTSIMSACLNRAVVITAVLGLFPAPIGNTGSLLNSHIISGVDNADEESMGDEDSVGGSLNFEGAKYSKQGFVQVALLKRASSIDIMNKARQHERSFNFHNEGRSRLTPQEEQMRTMFAMGNLNGPLPAPNSVMTWVEAARSSQVAHMAMSGQSFKQDELQLTTPDSPKNTKDTSKVMDLAIRLEELLVKNDNASELEKLPRETFVVDLKRRDAAIAINRAHAARVREEIEEEDAARDLISARILAVCEGGMEAKAKEVHAFKEEHCIVPNLPVPRLSAERARKLECVKRLRLIEMKEISFAKKNFMDGRKTVAMRKGVWDMPHEVPDEIGWVENQGALTAKLDVVGDILEEEKAKKAKKNKPDGEGNSDNGGEDDEKKEESELDKGLQQLEMDGDEGTLEGGESVTASLHTEEETDDFLDTLDTSDIRSFLYPPTCLRTTSQRRAQVLFLDELVRVLKFKFNAHVDQLAALKLDEMEKIEERNIRIQEISKSLDMEDNSFKPVLKDTEKPESYLSVSDDELIHQKYETEEMKEKKRKAEEEKIAREKANKGDDLGTRALYDMMYGTLETKKEGALEKSLAPMPDWMAEMVVEDRLSEMNEEQREQHEDYLLAKDEFEKARQEERDLLTEEMHHLQLEVDEIVKQFDERVKEIKSLRVHAQLAVATQELYMMRLGVGLDEGDLLTEQGRQLETSRFKINVQKMDLDEQAAKWHKQVHAAKEKLADLHEEDARIEKTFRRSLGEVSEEPITNDVYKVYLSLFKMRRDSMSQHSGSGLHSTGAGRSSQRGVHGRRSTKAGMSKPTLMAAAGSLMGARRQTSKGVGFMGVMKAAAKDDEAKILAEAADPFSELDTVGNDAKKNGVGDVSSAKRLAEAAEQAAYAPLDPEMDIPDGFKISKDVWERLQQLRIDKIKCEIHIRKLTKKVNEMTKSTENIDTRDDAIALELKHVEHDMAILRKRKASNAKDFEVITRLHQGQNELLSTDLSFLSKFTPGPIKKYSAMGKSEKEELMHKRYPPLSVEMGNGILIDTEKILNLNEQIKAVGAEKVKALNKIKHFRKSINFMTWEDKYMSARLQDLEEFYTDLLLLRVEKSTLQAMRIGGGGGGSSSSDNKNNADDVAAKHERREDKTKQAFAVKEQRQLTANTKLAQQIQDRRNENEKLREQLTQLEKNIKIREAIYRARVPGGGGGGGEDSAVAARMKKVTMRRRLVDLARVQTEEIEFLRGELDRLRQRTFPSFAHAAKHRLQLPPDEII